MRKRTYVLVSTDGLIDVTRGEFIQLLIVTKNDDCDIDRAEDGKLMGLFEETAFSLEKGAKAAGLAAGHGS